MRFPYPIDFQPSRPPDDRARFFIWLRQLHQELGADLEQEEERLRRSTPPPSPTNRPVWIVDLNKDPGFGDY